MAQLYRAEAGQVGLQERLEIYALYKQATIGDVNIEQPYFFSVRRRIKWEAWNEKRGMPQDEAKRLYLTLVGLMTS